MTTRFTQEIRDDVVRRATEPGADIEAIAAELPVQPMMVRRWITMASNARKKKPVVKMSAGALGEQEDAPRKNDGEAAQLRAENARLRKDKEILKATLAMLIKDSS